MSVFLFVRGILDSCGFLGGNLEGYDTTNKMARC